MLVLYLLSLLQLLVDRNCKVRKEEEWTVRFADMQLFSTVYITQTLSKLLPLLKKFSSKLVVEIIAVRCSFAVILLTLLD